VCRMLHMVCFFVRALFALPSLACTPLFPIYLFLLFYPYFTPAASSGEALT
jgi:hypothetical protein